MGEDIRRAAAAEDRTVSNFAKRALKHELERVSRRESEVASTWRRTN
jgi:hypothetical protein